MRFWYLYHMHLKPPINALAEVSRTATGLKFGLSLHLHPYFVNRSSKGNGESVNVGWFARAFITLQCDKFQNLMSCLIQ